MTSPWIEVEPLADRAFAVLRRRAIFECHKWDPQIGDHCAIARYPLVITKRAWHEVVGLAEALAAETLAAEEELVRRPDLHRCLGIAPALRRALRDAQWSRPPAGAARLMRFDFHFTNEGWRISEVNSDVPGGLNEASGFPALMSAHYSWALPVGDPAGAYATSLARHAGAGATVALVHATSYSDDLQMMSYVARKLADARLSVQLASPMHLRWHGQRAHLESAWWSGPLDLVVRFFPAEWLSGLPRRTQWHHLFAGSRTPLSNPATALLTQTKRFPLVWSALDTPLPTWRALLPETRDPRRAPRIPSNEWVIKPALGRVGEDVGIRDVVDGKEMQRIVRRARWWPSSWVAQRRFHPLDVLVAGSRVFPCLGVYTLDRHVVGAYGRVAAVPLIDGRAADAAVLAA